MDIDEKKINMCLQKGKLEVKDHIKFKYIVEILRLFNIHVDGWMKGSYILNEKEGIMFTRNDNAYWKDKFDDEYMYEKCIAQEEKNIEDVNWYWGERKIYIFRKEDDAGYEFMGCFVQDTEKLKQLRVQGICDERPYKKIGEEVILSRFKNIPD